MYGPPAPVTGPYPEQDVIYPGADYHQLYPLGPPTELQQLPVQVPAPDHYSTAGQQQQQPKRRRYHPPGCCQRKPFIPSFDFIAPAAMHQEVYCFFLLKLRHDASVFTKQATSSDPDCVSR